MITYRGHWTRMLLALSLLLIPALALAVEPTPGMELERSRMSPHRDIVITHYVKKDKDTCARFGSPRKIGQRIASCCTRMADTPRSFSLPTSSG
jgi:hypothetical protein